MAAATVIIIINRTLFFPSAIATFIGIKFIHILIHSLIPLSIYPFKQSFGHNFFSIMHSFICSFICSFIHYVNDKNINKLASFIHSFIISCMILFIHSFIHSFMHSVNLFKERREHPQVEYSWDAIGIPRLFIHSFN